MYAAETFQQFSTEMTGYPTFGTLPLHPAREKLTCVSGRVIACSNEAEGSVGSGGEVGGEVQS
jgi:hypothetical protein